MGFLTTLLDRRSIENPATPLGSDPWHTATFGGGVAASGVTVNRKTALALSAVWRAMNMIPTDVSKLPLIVYRRKGEGRERAKDHPAYSLLLRKANREQTINVLLKTAVTCRLGDGNGYAFIARDGAGRPLELIHLDSPSTIPVRENGQLWYVVTIRLDSGDIQRKLHPDNVIHLRGLSYDGLKGLSVFDVGKSSIGLGIAAERYGGKFFANSLTPSVVLETPEKLSSDSISKLKEQWREMQGGLENAHKIAVLEGGMSLKPWSMTAKESQFVETRKLNVRDIANLFGVPPHKLGDETRTAFASLEQENQSYLDGALDGLLREIEMEFMDKLLTEREKEEDTHYIEFNRSALVRADLAARTESYAKATGGPWMTPNEVRRAENMNDIEGGDELNKAPNTPGDMDKGDEPEPTDGDDGDEDTEDDERAERAERADAERADRADRADRAQQKDDAERVARLEREIADRVERKERQERLDNAEKQERVERAERAEAEKQERAERSEAERVERISHTNAEHPERLRKALRALLVDVLRRMAIRIGKDAERASRTPDTFCAWADDDVVDRHMEVVKLSIDPLSVAMGAAGLCCSPAGVAVELLASISARMQHIAETTNANELAAAVSADVALWPDEIPERIADGTTNAE